MASLNKATLIGNLGRDPEIRRTQNGSKCVSFPLATSESWKDKASGERKEKTEWHRIVIWDERLGDVAEQYLRKGSKVYLEGAMETRKWADKDGQERYTTEIVLNRFRSALVMLDAPKDKAAEPPPTPKRERETAKDDDLDDSIIPF